MGQIRNAHKIFVCKLPRAKTALKNNGKVILTSILTKKSGHEDV
jgi:hypothetical protein